MAGQLWGWGRNLDGNLGDNTVVSNKNRWNIVDLGKK